MLCNVVSFVVSIEKHPFKMQLIATYKGCSTLRLARLEGFEPPTLGSEDQCSSPLSYRRLSDCPQFIIKFSFRPMSTPLGVYFGLRVSFLLKALPAGSRAAQKVKRPPPFGVVFATLNWADGDCFIMSGCYFGDVTCDLFDLCRIDLQDIKHVSITKIVSILSEQMTHPSAIICLIWHGVTLFSYDFCSRIMDNT